MPDDDPERLSEAAAEIGEFNAAFYASEPADILLTRFELLLLAGGRGIDLVQLLGQGVEYEGFRIVFDALAEETKATTAEEVTAPDLDRFLIVETQQLLHHAGETLLRLYFAHVGHPQVPWIELAQERQFAKFKGMVHETFIAGVPDAADLGWVFLGSAQRPDHADEAEWAGAIEGLGAFLAWFARSFLEDAYMYNAIKHGLGLTPSRAAFMALEEHLLGHGPSVVFPQDKPDPEIPGAREWSLTTRWLDLGQTLALTRTAIHMIDSIWRLGRHRYVEPDEPVAGLYYPIAQRPDGFRGPNRASAQWFTRHLLTVLPPNQS